MNVAILADPGNADGTLGGAKYTMAEFAAAAPAHVTLVDTVDQAGTVVIGNCVTLPPSIIDDLRGKRIYRYHNDLARFEHPELREWLVQSATHVFTSPLHQRLYGMDGVWPNVPPPVNLSAFRPSRENRRKRARREGACAVAPWMNPGKGQWLLREWSDAHQAVNVYGSGPFTPHGPNLNVMGPLAPEDVPAVLWAHKTFIHLPTAPEPFGRAVVEAWAAGCELVVNRLVGALHYIENDPDALESAGVDFWNMVARERVTA